jgi:RNA polymerase sigma-70 factor (ECF subfamily)
MSMTSAQPLTYYEFDAAYLHGLKVHDPLTEDHFVGYFNSVLRMKLRGRSPNVEQQNDIRQETFARVLTAIRTPGRIRQPERLGAFVTSVCNNILYESFRTEKRYQPIEALPAEPQDCARSPEAVYTGEEAARKVKDAVSCLPYKERTVLRAIYFEEKDKDEICTQFGINRSNLQVLLHRAREKFLRIYK